ncbi:MAG: hypothetical protein HYR66_04895 [Sphingobacteriales bacterium]|nr:hypothetical protein [Sphingobacteriales bacterium]MBI3718666.1 hypothetical protein [Sphingobacteriales bacterium]
MLKQFIFFLIVILFACNVSPKKDYKIETFPVKPLFIDKGEEEGWGADIRLSVTSVIETDTTKEITGESSYNGDNLGLLVSVPKAKEGEKGFAKGLTLKSIGKESNYLLSTLVNLYKQKPDTSLIFTNNISVNYVNLSEFAKHLVANYEQEDLALKEYKLFFEGKNDEDYAELFLNINLNEHWIELREKDEEYRSLLINSSFLF